MTIDEDFTVKNHPKNISWNKEYDLFHYENYIKESFIKKVVRFIKKKIGLK